MKATLLKHLFLSSRCLFDSQCEKKKNKEGLSGRSKGGAAEQDGRGPRAE